MSKSLESVFFSPPHPMSLSGKLSQTPNEVPMAIEREPAPAKIRIPEIRVELEKFFPGADLRLQHGHGCGQAEIKFDEYELRVMVSGPAEAKRNTTIRFIQRIERGKMRVLLSKQTDDWYEIVGAIEEARAIVRGIIYSLKSVLTPKRTKVINGIEDLLSPDY